MCLIGSRQDARWSVYLLGRDSGSRRRMAEWPWLEELLVSCVFAKSIDSACLVGVLITSLLGVASRALGSGELAWP